MGDVLDCVLLMSSNDRAILSTDLYHQDLVVIGCVYDGASVRRGDGATSSNEDIGDDDRITDVLRERISGHGNRRGRVAMPAQSL